jgi:hypothetical protein
MLENAIRACPDRLWGENSNPWAFWYLAYHTLFWLDFYLATSRAEFTPPPGHGMSEMDPAGAFPDRVYTKDEILNYLEHCRRKLRTTIDSLTAEQAATPRDTRPELPFVEALLYNMRHVQHHTAQINLLLRQGGVEPPRWVSIARM